MYLEEIGNLCMLYPLQCLQLTSNRKQAFSFNNKKSIYRTENSLVGHFQTSWICSLTVSSLSTVSALQSSGCLPCPQNQKVTASAPGIVCWREGTPYYRFVFISQGTFPSNLSIVPYYLLIWPKPVICDKNETIMKDRIIRISLVRCPTEARFYQPRKEGMPLGR